MTERSSRREVRNPLLALPGWRAFAALLDEHPVVKARFVLLARDLSTTSRAKADECWRRHKAPMAVYWKCVAVYAGHLARGLASGAGR